MILSPVALGGEVSQDAPSLCPAGLLHLFQIPADGGLQVSHLTTGKGDGRGFRPREIIQRKIPVVRLDFKNINQFLERVTKLFNNC